MRLNIGKRLRCSTAKLFCCLILIVLFAVLNMYWQSIATTYEDTVSEEGTLKRAKRRKSLVLSTQTLVSSSRPPVSYYVYKPQNSNHTLQLNDVAPLSSQQKPDVSDSRLNLYTEKYFLVLILIHSGIDQKTRRDAIRNTWLSSSMIGNVSLMYWFVIGGKLASDNVRTSILEEQDHHNDLLILWNVRNNYSELSLRSLHSMTHIANHYQYSYMLKTDDDVFLNTPIILKELKAIYPLKRLYWGHFSCHNPPMEDGRWKEKNWHWCDVYYPYAYGGMYILSHDVVQLIADNANSLQCYSCEDVSLGAWLASYNLYRLNDARIFVKHGTHCSRGYIAVHIKHYLCHKVMKKYFDNLKRNGVLCTTLVKENILVWEGLPHLCLNNTKVIV